MPVFNKYADFSGRAMRTDFWYFMLFLNLSFFFFVLLDAVIGTFHTRLGFGLLSGIFALLLLFPAVAVSVRRLHDTNRSGWWMLIWWMPIAVNVINSTLIFSILSLMGAVVLVVFWCQPSDSGVNRFGKKPNE